MGLAVLLGGGRGNEGIFDSSDDGEDGGGDDDFSGEQANEIYYCPST